ncbi:hypothetical protein AGLY_017341 [Aphis glycines]|uniref:Alcohol dehydrogenase-like N-terminal domain-containing protein n=1 Tax=Aphis glycines TaxID=307491 RepID=A0A6G0SVT1_APHGL|nr:hypothetical protein AGLY_017341 [Aphis glycines]
MADTMGKVIKCKAAVVWEAKKPLTLEDIEVALPKENKVRVKILTTAICHTDAYTTDANDPEGTFPCILGHEGAGIVESDRVIPLYILSMEFVNFVCLQKQNVHSKIRLTQGQGKMPDNTSRFTCKGNSLILHNEISTSTVSCIFTKSCTSHKMVQGVSLASKTRSIIRHFTLTLSKSNFTMYILFLETNKIYKLHTEDPGWNSLTFEPTLSTIPAPSWPKIQGKVPSGSLASVVYASNFYSNFHFPLVELLQYLQVLKVSLPPKQRLPYI